MAEFQVAVRVYRSEADRAAGKVQMFTASRTPEGGAKMLRDLIGRMPIYEIDEDATGARKVRATDAELERVAAEVEARGKPDPGAASPGRARLAAVGGAIAAAAGAAYYLLS